MKGYATDEAPLRETQRWLASLILDPEKLDDAAVRAEIAELLAQPCHGAAVERLRAYTGGYPARIGESLAESHPALKHVVGASAFQELVGRYLGSVPLGIRNLNEVGRGLAAILATDRLAEELPFIVDLARLEAAVHAAFHAREKPALDPATVAGWTLEDWNCAVLEFQPAVAVVRSDWPIREIWAARNTPVEDIDIALEGRRNRVLVHRAGFDVACETIDDDEAFMLDTLRAGVTLGDAAEALAERGGDAEAVARWLRHWSASGLVAGCSRAGDEAR